MPIVEKSASYQPVKPLVGIKISVTAVVCVVVFTPSVARVRWLYVPALLLVDEPISEVTPVLWLIEGAEASCGGRLSAL